MVNQLTQGAWISEVKGSQTYGGSCKRCFDSWITGRDNSPALKNPFPFTFRATDLSLSTRPLFDVDPNLIHKAFLRVNVLPALYFCCIRSSNLLTRA